MQCRDVRGLDEFLVAFNCHCSNCRATTGLGVSPWGEIEREKLRVTKGEGSLMPVGDAGGDHEMRCRDGAVHFSTGPRVIGTHVRVPYGTLVDQPALKPTAHMFVGSKAPWFQILDDLPQHVAYPWS